jgi:hypothetical protein
MQLTFSAEVVDVSEAILVSFEHVFITSSRGLNHVHPFGRQILIEVLWYRVLPGGREQLIFISFVSLS